MPTQHVPESGDSPLSGPRTCDASGMFEIHRMLQHAFEEATGLVDGVREHDAAHAADVASQLRLISTALHAHHEGEDSRLWGMLEQRAPSCFLHVQRMKRQHADMLDHLSDLDAAIPAWKVAPAPDTATPVRKALAGVVSALAEHFPDEETTIVPVIEHVVTQQEEDWFSKHGRAATPRGQAWNMLGAILVAQPDGGKAWLKKHMPGPAGLIWRWIGAPLCPVPRRARTGLTVRTATPPARAGPSIDRDLLRK